MGKKILITGTAGFIGFHLVKKILNETDWSVVGLDNINDYYDINLKYARLNETGIKKEEIEYNKGVVSSSDDRYKFLKLDLIDKENMFNLFKKEKFDYVVNLAAQAGVRYSLTHPESYIQSNIVGFLNILEGCRHNGIKHLVYASSSSVYGLNKKQPFSTHDSVDHPISIYAATKKSNELMAHTYSYLYNLPTTGLRFFTVYGPWGRPDMALFLFTKSILEDKTIDVFNYGEMQRDFTYVDDITNGIMGVLKSIPGDNQGWGKNDMSSSKAPYKVYNIGNNNPVKLLDFIEEIEKKLNKKAKMNLMPLQPGDVPSTYADVNELIEDINYKPNTYIEFGIKKFVDWYKKYYKL